jgi:hypothetical protein
MEWMANPTTPVLLRLARNMCSTIINLQIGPDALQEDAFELMRLLGRYEASILAPHASQTSYFVQFSTLHRVRNFNPRQPGGQERSSP